MNPDTTNSHLKNVLQLRALRLDFQRLSTLSKMIKHKLYTANINVSKNPTANRRQKASKIRKKLDQHKRIISLTINAITELKHKLYRGN